jgi:zinc finger CCHC domain-containing protein 9
MTRFARARGSKASNERAEEDATPWSVIKAQMNATTKKHDDVENLEDDDGEGSETLVEASKQRHSHTSVEDLSGSDGEDDEGDDDEEDPKQTKKSSSQMEPVDGEGKKKARKRAKDKCLNCKEKGHLKKECPKLSEERRKELQELYQMKIERKGKGTGRKKNKNKGKGNKAEESKDKPPRTPSKKENNQKQKPKKRVVVDKAGNVVQEGESLFQGFRVKEEDAKRLIKLQRDLAAKGASGEELREALKLERRRAEKELARSKKSVCFHCRQPGHVLADCPQAQKEQLKRSKGDLHAGMCFKCGSTEHSSRDCASKRKGEDAFAFAVCFVCKERGHLAKACPDNPRGLYPKGGGCRFCGSVEHLKSECPRKVEKDARDEIRAETINAGSLEDEPEIKRARTQKKAAQSAKRSKVVTF